MKNLKIYLSLTKFKLRESLIYKTAFWGGIIGQWFSSGVNFFTVYILINSFNDLSGWNKYEMLILYSFYLLSYSISAMFFYTPCTQLEKEIRLGNFDVIMIKPTTPIVYLIFSQINIGYISHITLSLFLLIFSFCKLNLCMSLGKIVLIIVFMIGSILIQNAIYVFSSLSSFFIFFDNPIINFIITELRNFIKYPLDIYGFTLKLAFTIIPIGFINYYPIIIILNKNSSSDFFSYLGYATPIIGIVMFVISIMSWNKCIMHYQSTGN